MVFSSFSRSFPVETEVFRSVLGAFDPRLFAGAAGFWASWGALGIS